MVVALVAQRVRGLVAGKVDKSVDKSVANSDQMRVACSVHQMGRKTVA